LFSIAALTMPHPIQQIKESRYEDLLKAEGDRHCFSPEVMPQIRPA
jgi:hypothetical protein